MNHLWDSPHRQTSLAAIPTVSTIWITALDNNICGSVECTPVARLGSSDQHVQCHFIQPHHITEERHVRIATWKHRSSKLTEYRGLPLLMYITLAFIYLLITGVWNSVMLVKTAMVVVVSSWWVQGWQQQTEIDIIYHSEANGQSWP